jgi:hypothetical protein
MDFAAGGGKEKLQQIGKDCKRKPLPAKLFPNLLQSDGGKGFPALRAVIYKSKQSLDLWISPQAGHPRTKHFNDVRHHRLRQLLRLV